jgi:uncharacterized membrane protein
MGTATFVLTFVAALGCGLGAGVFYGFSTYVMPALGRLPAAQGIAAMQAINRVAPKPFMQTQAGTAVIAVAAAVAVLLDWDPSYGWYVLAAAPIYVLGVIVLTGGYHIPRNNAIDKLDPADPASEASWRRYLVEWTSVNHLRAILPLVACGLEVAALAAA